MNQSRDNQSRRRRRGGFTLVELLVAMAVTLILIMALAQAFAIVGETVSEGRATIEMSVSLRSLANRLQDDLDGITVAVRPWIDDSAGRGYFEILDGPSTDVDWNSDDTYDTDPSNSNTMLGDIDDILAFTATSKDSPYVAQVGDHMIQLGYHLTPFPASNKVMHSTTAEIVWWIQYYDLDGNGLRDAGEEYMICRRMMLIRPDLGYLPTRPYNQGSPTYNRNGSIHTYTWSAPQGLTITGNTSTGEVEASYPDTQGGYAELKKDMFNFFNNNDISVNIRWSQGGGRLRVRLRANSLADLTRRENRYAHVTMLSDCGNQTNSIEPAPVTTYDSTYRALPGPVFPYAMDVNRRSITSVYRLLKFGNNAGEDVMTRNALGFDVQVFDPSVQLRPSINGAEALIPSDPAYFLPIWRNPGPPPVGGPPDTIGYGDFVDLGYGARFHDRPNAASPPNPDASNAFTNGNALSWSVFAGLPAAKSDLHFRSIWKTPTYCYCTWSTHYERDGVDQDNDGTDDQGTNGFDDLVTNPNPPPTQHRVNGVDDAGERETSPPYPAPLRGVQVRIRIWDPDSRQIRQVSVVSDFVPE